MPSAAADQCRHSRRHDTNICTEASNQPIHRMPKAQANGRTTSLQRFLASGAAAWATETITLPIDIAKVRLQTQAPLKDGSFLYRNMVQTCLLISKQEGFRALWKGYNPALLRQVSYTGIQLVIYAPIRDFISAGKEANDISFFRRVAASGSAGVLSIVLCNPADVLKTRMQSTTGRNAASMATVFRDIQATDGVGGLWRGVGPNVVRSFVGCACEVGCYDQFKTSLLHHQYFTDGTACHLAASTGAGWVSAVVSTPVDVVKTRLMFQAGSGGDQVGSQMVRYKGVVDCFAKIYQFEGLRSFYSGFLPLAVRKVGWTVIFFLAYEKMLYGVSGQYS